MTIVSTSFTENYQADGRKRVRVYMTDDEGTVHSQGRMVTGSLDVAPLISLDPADRPNLVDKLEARLADRVTEELKQQKADEGYQALTDFLFAMTPANRRSALGITRNQDEQMMIRDFGWEVA